jgi:hypothetical protein
MHTKNRRYKERKRRRIKGYRVWLLLQRAIALNIYTDDVQKQLRKMGIGEGLFMARVYARDMAGDLYHSVSRALDHQYHPKSYHKKALEQIQQSALSEARRY